MILTICLHVCISVCMCLYEFQYVLFFHSTSVEAMSLSIIDTRTS